MTSTARVAVLHRVAPLVASLAAVSLQGCMLTEILDSPTPSSSSTSVPVPALSDGRLSLAASTWGGGPRLAVTVAPSTIDGIPAQRLVLDTGSSTLAFCDSSLASEVTAAQTEYYSCNMYGVKGQGKTFYYGAFYQGGLQVGEAWQIDGAYFSVMQSEENMPCVEGFQGIFGIAFKQLDQAFQAQAVSSLLSGEASSCPTQGAVDIVPPLMHMLNTEVPVQDIGIYWSGSMGDDQGGLYLGRAAMDNEYYNGGVNVGSAALGELGWYDITITGMLLGGSGQAWSDFSCKPGSHNCILDTGTPELVLPKAVVDATNQLLQEGAEPGSLQITLGGVQGGSSVTLDFPISLFVQNNWISAGEGPSIILGLPLWSVYYTVMHLDSQSVQFVSMTGAGGQAAAENPTTTQWWQDWSSNFDADNSSGLIDDFVEGNQSGRALSEQSTVMV